MKFKEPMIFDKDLTYVIAGKEEGFTYTNAKLVVTLDRTLDTTIEKLRGEGYTQFIFTKKTGYEYTIDGEIIRNGLL